MANVFNTDELLKRRRRFVDLACGHKALTSAAFKVVCTRSSEMLKRSIETGDEDYESFRRGAARDQMIWRDDPCRVFHEQHDLDGKFIADY